MKIAVLGHWGHGSTMLNGQTVKTKNLVDGLKKYTTAEIVIVDSHGWSKRPLSLFVAIKKAFQECNAIIMLPAQNGVLVFSPLLLHYKKKYHKKIFYDVIGGWLPEFLHDKKRLGNALKLFDGIWVETNTMRDKLIDQGFDNISVVPNFKELQILTADELVFPESMPYRLCTFSRVMKEKGIEDAVQAVKRVNENLGTMAYALDIYGQIDEHQLEWFETLEKSFPGYIHYCGCVDPAKSVDVLKDYFALLFPTHFRTEGIPGTIIDAYSAGVPVIASRWESFTDIVDDGITGIGYDFDNCEQLEQALSNMVFSPEKFNSLKLNCIHRAECYSAKKLAELIAHNIER